MSTVILIPARKGSSRIKNKNIIKLGRLPLISYTFKLAQELDFADKVFLSTNCEKTMNLAKKYSFKNHYNRPEKVASKFSTDFEWITDSIRYLEKKNQYFENFIILRPTSPFRKVNTIKRAFNLFNRKNCHSLRAVRLCNEHPNKMWQIKSNFLKPLINIQINGQPGHSNPYQKLPKIYVQDSSLEICKTKNLYKFKNISGKKIIPFIMPYYEGFDINFPEDLAMASNILKKLK